MGEWKEYKLGEVAVFGTEKLSSSLVSLENYISTENMLPNKGGIEQADKKPENGLITHYCNGDILISNIRPYFKKIWLADRTGGCSNDVLCIRPKTEDLNNTFLFYVLSQDDFFEYVMLGSKGCKMPRGDKSHIMNFQVVIPPLSEQKRIASILSSLDDKIDLLQRENKTLEAMAETLFRKWFIEDAKEEWEKGLLENLIIIKYGKDHKALDDGDIPVIGSGGIIRYANKFLYSKESVLIPRKGSLNNILYIDEPFWTVDTMFYTEMKRANIAKFVYLFIKGVDLESMNVGSAVPSMTVQELNNIPLNIPEQEYFDAFENITNPLFTKIKNNNKQIKNLSITRDSILHKLMSKAE